MGKWFLNHIGNHASRSDSAATVAIESNHDTGGYDITHHEAGQPPRVVASASSEREAREKLKKYVKGLQRPEVDGPSIFNQL